MTISAHIVETQVEKMLETIVERYEIESDIKISDSTYDEIIADLHGSIVDIICGYDWPEQ